MIARASQMLHKSVLVTGGASGIGLAITELFLSEGANVFVLDFSGDNLEAAKIQLCKVGFNEAAFRLHQADAADEESVAKAVTECIAVFGSLDVAILNAGVGSVSVIADTSVEEYDRVMRANARSVFVGIKQVGKKMQESGKGGSIVVTASLASIEAFPTIGAYNASKSAARAIMHTAAREYAEHGIRVNCVSPGYTATPMVQAWGNLEERLKSVPLGRAAEPAEVARLHLFLASDESAMVTGSNYRIDGGMSCH